LIRTDWLRPLAQGVLGIAFVAAGGIKMTDPLGFGLSLVRLDLLPRIAVGPVAILLPGVEIVTGLALLALPSYRRAALGILGTLLAVFTAGLAITIMRGTASSCGCFGVDGGVLGRPDVGILRNAILGGLAVFLATSSPRSEPASPASGKPG
jgi:hypothetical protein